MASITYLLEKHLSQSLAPYCSDISSSLYGFKVYKGTDVSVDADGVVVPRTAPCILTFADNAREEFIDSGIWHIPTEITVVAMAPETTVAQMDSYYDTTMDIIYNMTSSSDLTVLGRSSTAQEKESQGGDTWRRIFSLEIACIG